METWEKATIEIKDQACLDLDRFVTLTAKAVKFDMIAQQVRQKIIEDREINYLTVDSDLVLAAVGARQFLYNLNKSEESRKAAEEAPPPVEDNADPEETGEESVPRRRRRADSAPKSEEE